MRYVDADDLDNTSFDFDGLDVESAAGDKLGDVDGFVIDVNSGRPYYIVVNSGGWFRSKNYLLPVGHARLDRQREVLVADLTRDRIEKFPGFDKDEFEKLSDSELDRFGTTTAAACCEGEAADAGRPWHERSHYNQPNWWQTGYYRPERMVSNEPPTASRDASAAAMRPPVEQISARERSAQPMDRAKPGDILGVETGGEQTHVGDTREDEQERQRKADDKRER